MFPAPGLLMVAATLVPSTGPPPARSEAPIAAIAIIPKFVPWAPELSSPRGTGAEQENLFTLTDYFDQGQRLALRYLNALEPAARGEFELAALAPACVQVSCERDGGRSMTFSTGVLVNGGRQIVTAGHGVGAVGDAADEVFVILGDGRKIAARVMHRSDMASKEQDWAVLEFKTPVPTSLVSVPVGAARPGALAFIMGYPERTGIGSDGQATSALTSEPRALGPLLFVARVPLSTGSELDPVAGALPLSGASGSPVFDEHGALVGVLVAVGRLAYPDGLRHVYRVSLSAEFKAAIGS